MAKKKVLSLEEKLEEALISKEDHPYEIPNNWEWVKLGETIKLISGRDVSKNYCNDNGNGIPYLLGASNIIENGLKIERWIEKPVVIGLKEDIILSVKGTIGKLMILEEEDEVHLSRQLMGIRPKINLKYVFYFIKSYIEKLKEQSRGIIPGISREDILDIKFPLASLAEQERMVTKVESMLDKVKQAKELISEARETFELRRASILHQAFTGGLTKKWREEASEKSEIRNQNVDELLEKINEEKMTKWEEESKKALEEGKRKPKKPVIKTVDEMKVPLEEQPYELPEGWSWVRLGEVGEVKGGKRLPKGEELVIENTGFPYIRAGELKNGTVNKENIKYLRENIYEKIKNYTVKFKDVYITIVGACIGDSGVIPLEMDGANLTENAAKITNLISLDNYFLSFWLRTSSCQYFIKEKILSATLGKLSLNRIKNLPVPLPPLAEQKEIVKKIEEMLEAEEKAKELLDMGNQIELLEKSILSKAFRGEFGTNDKSDEPAIKLLRRVLGEGK